MFRSSASAYGTSGARKREREGTGFLQLGHAAMHAHAAATALLFWGVFDGGGACSANSRTSRVPTALTITLTTPAAIYSDFRWLDQETTKGRCLIGADASSPPYIRRNDSHMQSWRWQSDFVL
jgi:hypothetical protein